MEGMSDPKMPVLSTPAPEPEAHPITLWNRDDPRAVVNLVPTKVAEALEAGLAARPELFEMEERELKKNVLPTPTDNQLRLAFWNEYNQAQEEARSMKMVAVYARICSAQYFHDAYLAKAEKVAWLLCPPAHYVTVMEEALTFGIGKLRDILDMDLVGKNGTINVKLGELQAKIVAMLDLRVKGAIPAKNLNLNFNAGGSPADVNKALTTNSMEEIERRIKELESRERASARDTEMANRPVRDIDVEVLKAK
jgi:hypothetical protein